MRVFTKLLRPVGSCDTKKGNKTADLFQQHPDPGTGGIVTVERPGRGGRGGRCHLGFIINLKKSVSKPTPVINFLGFTVDTREDALAPSIGEDVEYHKSMLTLIMCASFLGEDPRSCVNLTHDLGSSPRKLAHIISLLTSTLPAVLPAPLHYKALQRTRNIALRKSQTTTDLASCSQKHSRT